VAYRTIDESFWTDPATKDLSASDKLLFLYLITNPHAHYSGIYHIPVLYIAEELGLPPKTLKQCLNNLEAKARIFYDYDFSVVWVVNMCKYQIGQGGNPKVLKSGIEKHLRSIHSVRLIVAFNEKYQLLNLTLPERCNNVDETLIQRTVPVPVPVPVKERITKGRKSEEAKTLLPADFGISDRVRQWAKKKGHGRLDDHLEAFKRKCRAKGYKYVEWDDAFMEAIRENWAKLNGSSSGISDDRRDEIKREIADKQRMLARREKDLVAIGEDDPRQREILASISLYKREIGKLEARIASECGIQRRRAAD
jgi:hypothetical protein